jgi:hypothetical protein
MGMYTGVSPGRPEGEVFVAGDAYADLRSGDRAGAVREGGIDMIGSETAGVGEAASAQDADVVKKESCAMISTMSAHKHFVYLSKRTIPCLLDKEVKPTY